MKIELKNIKVLSSLSEETNCYTADLYIDGIKTASASNHGHGGCDDYRAYTGQDARLEAAYKWAKEQPAIVCDDMKDPNDKSKPFTYEPDLEHFVGEILTSWLIEKDLKKLLKKPALMTSDGKILTYSCKPDDARLKPLIAEKEKQGMVYLNALPFDKALEKYKAHA